MRKEKILWRCPNCLADISDDFVCKRCDSTFAWNAELGRVSFLPNVAIEKEASNELRNYFKRWPNFYYFVAVIFGPAYFGGLSPKSFLHKYHLSGVTLNVGSGPKRITDSVVNLDIFSFEGVDVIADSEVLPFRDDSVAMIICDTVLEHVKNPSKVLEEFSRVLVKSGKVYITTPFLYPFHASPDDFNRWTKEGIILAMKDFNIKEVGVRSGPLSAVTAFLCSFFALIFSFGSERLYWFVFNVSMFIFFPIKYLDILVSRLPFSANMASILYVVGEKK